MRPHKAVRQAWILEWAKSHPSNCNLDSMNEHFHQAYHERFPEYARNQVFWGAQRVARAMQDLSEMERDGLLDKFRIGLAGNWQPGFPKWVWTYHLPFKKALATAETVKEL